MRIDKFKPIELLFFPLLKDEAQKINSDFKDVTCNAFVHYPPDNELQRSYFSISLECLLNKADFDKTDAISLGIDIDDHNGKFLITVDVAWGYPKAETVERIFEEPISITEEVLIQIQENLPELISKLRKLIQDNPKGI